MVLTLQTFLDSLVVGVVMGLVTEAVQAVWRDATFLADVRAEFEVMRDSHNSPSDSVASRFVLGLLACQICLRYHLAFMLVSLTLHPLIISAFILSGITAAWLWFSLNDVRGVTAYATTPSVTAVCRGAAIGYLLTILLVLASAYSSGYSLPLFGITVLVAITVARVAASIIANSERL